MIRWKIPHNSESVESRCGTGNHQYCELYLALANPPAEVSGIAGAKDDDLGEPEPQIEEIPVPGRLCYSANHVPGSAGRKGGIVRRPEEPFSEKVQDGQLALPTALVGIPDHSVRVLIMDAAESGSAFPWHMLAKKLVADKAVVISLSPLLTELAERADYIIPAPAHLEA